VLTAVGDGAPTLDAVARATALPRDVVEAAVHHLVRAGRLSAAELSIGCPVGGCGSCAFGSAAGPGCGADGPSTQRSGPVLVAFTIRRG
jgi:hypothetical protein